MAWGMDGEVFEHSGWGNQMQAKDGEFRDFYITY